MSSETEVVGGEWLVRDRVMKMASGTNCIRIEYRIWFRIRHSSDIGLFTERHYKVRFHHTHRNGWSEKMKRFNIGTHIVSTLYQILNRLHLKISMFVPPKPLRMDYAVYDQTTRASLRGTG